jgi:hypothetical protein
MMIAIKNIRDVNDAKEQCKLPYLQKIYFVVPKKENIDRNK